MRALLLEFQHDGQQTLGPDFATLAQLGDIVVLAEPAAEVAVAEEDGAGTTRAGDRRFFPVVKLGERDLEVLGCAADAELL